MPIKKENSISKTDKTKKPSLTSKKFPTLKFKNERDIAMDFAQKVYVRFDKLVKTIALFGTTRS